MLTAKSYWVYNDVWAQWRSHPILKVNTHIVCFVHHTDNHLGSTDNANKNSYDLKVMKLEIQKIILLHMGSVPGTVEF